MLRPGQSIIPFTLPSLKGEPWQLSSLDGKPYLLAFFRFASCPFCNLRLHQLVNRLDELPADFTLVAVFESSVTELQRYAERHDSPFPILADEGGVIHRQYRIQHSWLGVFKGMLLRMPALLYAIFKKGYVPLTIGGRMDTLPADFLVDRNGIIREAFYGRDDGDHLDFARIRQFAQGQSDRAKSVSALVKNGTAPTAFKSYY
ncbi:peroxiredoxin family protein [Porticoccus sp.]